MGEQSAGGAAVPPRSVRIAVRLMYAGSGVTLMFLLLVLPSFDDGLAEIGARWDRLGLSITTVLVAVTVIAPLVVGLVGSGLWVWMAIMNTKGRSWARVLATVFFACACVGGLLAIVSGSAGGVLALGYVLIGLVAVVLLWRPEAAPHYGSPESTGT